MKQPITYKQYTLTKDTVGGKNIIIIHNNNQTIFSPTIYDDGDDTVQLVLHPSSQKAVTIKEMYQINQEIQTAIHAVEFFNKQLYKDGLIYKI